MSTVKYLNYLGITILYLSVVLTQVKVKTYYLGNEF